MNILVIYGPNLNLLGKREPEIYGHATLQDLETDIKAEFTDHNFTFVQSNHEGVLIDWIHEHGFKIDAIIANFGGYTHTSIALRDAISAVPARFAEVHISNIHEREAFRDHSYFSDLAEKVVIGEGLKGYSIAVNHLIQ